MKVSFKNSSGGLYFSRFFLWMQLAKLKRKYMTRHKQKGICNKQKPKQIYFTIIFELLLRSPSKRATM